MKNIEQTLSKLVRKLNEELAENAFVDTLSTYSDEGLEYIQCNFPAMEFRTLGFDWEITMMNVEIMSEWDLSDLEKVNESTVEVYLRGKLNKFFEMLKCIGGLRL